MRKLALIAPLVLFFVAIQASVVAQDGGPATVVFSEAGFPVADSASPSALQLAAALPGAQTANADQLASLLAAPTTHLLVLPQGSAFPEIVWPAIKQFLDRGGNLLTLGGMPFTRAAYRDQQGWHLRDYGVGFIRPLQSR